MRLTSGRIDPAERRPANPATPSPGHEDDVRHDERLDLLCAAATARARGRGHALDGWHALPDEGRARRSSCTRCDRVVYVRIEDGLEGMAGRALSETCTHT